MNCQDISLLLDDGDPGALDASALAEVQVHLDSCADCAADWNMQVRLMRRELPEPDEVFVSRLWQAMARAASSGRGAVRSGRPLLLGGILLVGAAAAMLSIGPFDEAGQWLVDTARTPAAVFSGSEGPRSGGAGGGHALSAATDARDPRIPAASIQANRLLVLATEVDGLTREELRVYEIIRNAMLAELRAIPAINVVAPSAEELEAADVRVPLLVRLLAMIGFGERDPVERATARHFGAERWVQLVAGFNPLAPVMSDANFSRAGIDVRYNSFADDFRITGGGGGARLNPAERGQHFEWDINGRGIAVRVFRLLFRDGQQAYLEDLVTTPRFNDEQRLRMLYMFDTGGFGPAPSPVVNDEVIEGLIGFARTASDGSIRAQVWTRIASSGHPAGALPLTEALLYDPDERVRTTAIDELDRYLPELAVSIALENSAANDPSPELRERARWSLMYPAERLAEVESKLVDTNLSPEERTRALILARTEGLSPAGDPGQLGFLNLADSSLDALTEIAVLSEDPATVDIALMELGRRGDMRLVDLWFEQLDPALRSRMAILLGNYLDVEQNRELYERLREIESDEGIRRQMSDRLNPRRF